MIWQTPTKTCGYQIRYNLLVCRYQVSQINNYQFSSKLIEQDNYTYSLTTSFEDLLEKISFRNRVGKNLTQPNWTLKQTLQTILHTSDLKTSKHYHSWNETILYHIKLISFFVSEYTDQFKFLLPKKPENSTHAS